MSWLVEKLGPVPLILAVTSAFQLYQNLTSAERQKAGYLLNRIPTFAFLLLAICLINLGWALIGVDSDDIYTFWHHNVTLGLLFFAFTVFFVALTKFRTPRNFDYLSFYRTRVLYRLCVGIATILACEIFTYVNLPIKSSQPDCPNLFGCMFTMTLGSPHHGLGASGFFAFFESIMIVGTMGTILVLVTRKNKLPHKD